MGVFALKFTIFGQWSPYRPLALDTLYEKIRFFPDNFVEKEAQRQKCREFCRQSVWFCLEDRKMIILWKKKLFFHKTVATGNRTCDPHIYC